MDEFDRELRELIEGTADEPLFLEPSAAERARAGAVREKVAERDGNPARRRRRLAGGDRLLAAAAALVILIVAAGLAWLRFGRAAGGLGDVLPANAGAAAPSPMGTVSPVDLFDVPPADPFLGTAADRWADGAAGIVAPAARPAGGFTAAQVAAAYATTRKLLIAANLDRKTLLGGAPTAFARLLTAGQRATFLAGLTRKGVTRNGDPLSTRSWVASFAPGSAELIGNVIKVHGTMRARAVPESGTVALAIEVDYRFAYAVEPPHDPVDWTRVVDHVHGSIDFARWDDPGGALEPWDRAVIGNAAPRCGTGDGYIHPAYPGERSVEAERSGLVIDPYSTVASAPGGGAACGRVMRA